MLSIAADPPRASSMRKISAAAQNCWLVTGAEDTKAFQVFSAAVLNDTAALARPGTPDKTLAAWDMMATNWASPAGLGG